MTTPANDRYAKYRTRAEIADDEARERHLNAECGDDCRWCRDLDEMAAYWDENERRCKRCGSTDFTREGDRECCATCLK